MSTSTSENASIVRTLFDLFSQKEEGNEEVKKLGKLDKDERKGRGKGKGGVVEWQGMRRAGQSKGGGGYKKKRRREYELSRG